MNSCTLQQNLPEHSRAHSLPGRKSRYVYPGAQALRIDTDQFLTSALQDGDANLQAVRAAAVSVHHLGRGNFRSIGQAETSAGFNIQSREIQVMTALSGKTALVTGASHGIGRASTLALAKAADKMLVHYGRGAKEAEAVVAQIRKAGGRADAIAADLAAPDGPHRLAKQVRAIIGSRLDILVANAGMSKAATIADTTVEEFRCVVRSQRARALLSVQQPLPLMGARAAPPPCPPSPAGRARRRSAKSVPAYAATKGAVDTLVKHFASALGEAGHPRQRRRPGGRADRDVELHQDGGRTGFHPENAGPQAPLHTPEDIAAARSPSSPLIRPSGSPAIPSMSNLCLSPPVDTGSCQSTSGKRGRVALIGVAAQR